MDPKTNVTIYSGDKVTDRIDLNYSNSADFNNTIMCAKSEITNKLDPNNDLIIVFTDPSGGSFNNVSVQFYCFVSKAVNSKTAKMYSIVIDRY